MAVDTQHAGLLRLLPAGHVLQIRNDKIDLVVAQMIGRKARHGHARAMRARLWGRGSDHAAPAGVKYSVGFCGTLRSGPTFEAPAPFSL